MLGSFATDPLEKYFITAQCVIEKTCNWMAMKVAFDACDREVSEKDVEVVNNLIALEDHVAYHQT